MRMRKWAQVESMLRKGFLIKWGLLILAIILLFLYTIVVSLIVCNHTTLNKLTTINGRKLQ